MKLKFLKKITPEMWLMLLFLAIIMNLICHNYANH